MLPRAGTSTTDDRSDKFTLRIYGDALPRNVSSGREDTTRVLFEAVNEKFGFSFGEAERAQVKACHRTRGKAILASFNTALPGSVMQTLLFRDGNWEGRPGSKELKIEKFSGPLDGAILGALLYVRKIDKGRYDKDDARKRVVRADLEKLSNSPWYNHLDKDGKRTKVYVRHLDQALELMTEEERRDFIRDQERRSREVVSREAESSSDDRGGRKRRGGDADKGAPLAKTLR